MQSQQRGTASFYSKRSTGARTASGERLHHDSLVCAHRFYPFGTRLRVTNLNNGRAVIVRVIDRGPFGRQRIIDLSWAAAKAIGMIGQGVATVKVEVVQDPVPFRPNDDLNLPDVDFEVAEAGYSFIEHWKETETAENRSSSESANSGKRESSSRHAKGRSGARRTERYQKGKNTARAETDKNDNLQKQSSKGKSNSWRNVFEKLKHWEKGLLK